MQNNIEKIPSEVNNPDIKCAPVEEISLEEDSKTIKK